MRYIIVLILLFSASAYGASQQNQLNHLVEQIKNIKNILQQKHSKREALQQDLNKIETQYGQASQKRQQTAQEIGQEKQQIAALENAALLGQNHMQTEQRLLAEQLRLSYLLQRQSPVKVLLNQQDFNQMGRMLYYYQALNLYRSNAISQLQNHLEKINQQQQQLYAHYQTLQNLQQQQQSQENNLTVMKVNRTQLITTISQTIDDQKQQLVHLVANKQRLEDTLQRLARERIVTSGNFSNENFAAQRGHLPWPTRGQVLHYFNTTIEHSELKWNGELIAAQDEQPVYSVAAGTVVFSKWMEGYGLLIIINHGSGYMTLYGRNHSIYKSEGDKVSAGDLIATVGQSGGYDRPALYFAIRYNAKPLDPNQWCA